jgi:acetylornithine deacetylase/succinyl-diaminopimelate desuccinylase-like protein
MITQEMADRVLGSIDERELVALALDLGNLDSPSMSEGPVAQYVYDWMARTGFAPRKVALVPDRPNIVGTLPGTGGGKSLLLNGHLDTTISKEETWVTRRAAEPVFHSAWREGDRLWGNGVCNNKGPLASWLIGSKAVKDSGVKLKGDLTLTAVVAEIGLEPVDEFQPPQYTSKEAGARYLVNRGVVADYALVVEGTDFDLTWVEAGKAFFKLTIFSGSLPIYTPYIKRPHAMEQSPNAVVRMAKFIERLEAWAWEYEQKNTYKCPGGTVIPKVNIGAIRGGVPYKITKTLDVCTIYLDVRTTPVQDPLDIRDELQALITAAGFQGEVELYTYRKGYEGKGVEPMADAIKEAHQVIRREPPKIAAPPLSSMWRDLNVFNEVGIPSLTYGPGASVGGGNLSMRIADLMDGARVFALIICDICNRDRKPK